MKIAIVSPLMVPVPPVRYGGIERVVDILARGLASCGHEITVFCAGGSTVEGKNITRVESSPCPTGMSQHQAENRQFELAQCREVLSRQAEFDVINFHYEPAVFLVKDNNSNLLDAFKKPIVSHFHNVTTVPEHLAYYKRAESILRHTFVFVSESQRKPLSFFPHTKVIYNSLELAHFPFKEKKEPYLLFLGRIMREKGILDAISISRATNIPLTIVAKIDTVDRHFYETEVAPLIDGRLIRYAGEADHVEKVAYLQNARCLLFPIQWEEPFGLVMVEALACGTPVVAFRRGSVPEIIENGVNGCVVETFDEMVEAVRTIHTISPHVCRKSAEQFSAERMIREYENLYKGIA